MPTDTTGDAFVPSNDYGAATSSTSTYATLPSGQYLDGNGNSLNYQDYYGLGAVGSAKINVGVDERSDGPKGQETYGTQNQYVSVSDMVYGPNGFAALQAKNPNAWASVQSELYLAGFYSSQPTYGAMASKDASALKDAFEKFAAAQQSGVDISFSEWLQQNSAAGRAAGGPNGGSSSSGGGSTRAPLQLTSSATLDQYANNAGQNELGRALTAGEQQSFVNKYHGEETAQYNGGPQAAGAPDAEATGFVDSTDNSEMQTHMQADYAEKMLSMLGVQSG